MNLYYISNLLETPPACSRVGFHDSSSIVVFSSTSGPLLLVRIPQPPVLQMLLPGASLDVGNPATAALWGVCQVQVRAAIPYRPSRGLMLPVHMLSSCVQWGYLPPHPVGTSDEPPLGGFGLWVVCGALFGGSVGWPCQVMGSSSKVLVPVCMAVCVVHTASCCLLASFGKHCLHVL